MERIKPAEPVHFIDRESRQRDMGKRRSRFQVFLEIEMEKIRMARKITKEVALKEIRKAAIEQYGCLIPDGNVNVSLELPWTISTCDSAMEADGQGNRRNQFAPL